MPTTRLLTLVLSLAAPLALAACNPCHDACAHEASCNDKLGLGAIDVEDCTRKCQDNTTCVNRDEVNSCYADMKCENTLGYVSEALACASLCETK